MSKQKSSKEILSSLISRLTWDGKLLLAIIFHEIYYWFFTDKESSKNELCALSSTYYSASSQFKCRGKLLKPFWIVFAILCFIRSYWLRFLFEFYVPVEKMSFGQVLIIVAIKSKVSKNKTLYFLGRYWISQEDNINNDQKVLILREFAEISGDIDFCEEFQQILDLNKGGVETTTKIRALRTYAKICSLKFIPQLANKKMTEAYRLSVKKNVGSQKEKIEDEAKKYKITLT